MDVELAHQTPDPFARAMDAMVEAQFGPDLWHAVAAARAGMDSDDELTQARVLFMSLAKWTGTRGVVAAGRNAQQPTHPAHLVAGLLAPDELEDRYRAELVSMAKKGGCFF